MGLILASTSRYRRELLDRLAVPYLAQAHRCDETAAGGSIADAEARARSLARQKAESLASSFGADHVLGSDQVVDLEGRILGKPGDEAGAMAQLRELRGRAHRLITAVCLRHPDGRLAEAVDVHRMVLRALTDEEIERYVARERPWDCAGSYKIEGLGISLFASVEGRDFTAIVGLPLMAVSSLLREAGFAVP